MALSCRAAHLTVLITLALSCGPDGPGPDVVARVENAEITADELLRFRADMPALLRSEKEGVEELRDYLDSMIDMELMLAEARATGIEQDPDFQRRLQREIRQKLVFEFTVRQIKAKSDVPFEELRARFAKSKWNRMLLLAHIRTPTEEEALQALGEIEAGQSFEEEALERSILEKTARDGGLIRYWYGRDNLERLGLPLSVAEELFEKEVGTLAGPYQIDGHYEVFKIVDEKKTPASYIMAFAQTTLVRTFVAQRKETLDELKQTYQARLDPASITRFARWVAEAGEEALELSAEEEELVLCHLSDGQIAARDLYDLFQADGVFQPSEIDSARIASAIEDQLLPNALFYRGAVAMGLDRDSTLVAWAEAKKRALLIEAVQEREVEGHMDLSEAALKRYYQAQAQRFKLQEEIQVVEILVDAREEAQALLERIRKGEDMGELALRYSKRSGGKKSRGVFHMHPRERRRYGVLFDAARGAEVGTLQGPLEIEVEGKGEKRHSIFKVIDKLPPRPQAFAEARRKVRYWLHREEEDRLIGELFKRLRDQYAAQIVVFEDRLQTLDIDVESGS